MKPNRSMASIVYRKRYKCPQCGNYEYYCASDIKGICGCCKHVLKNSKQLIDNNDYNGYWLTAELLAAFVDLADNCEEKEHYLLRELDKLNNKKIFTDKEKKQIVHYICSSSDFDEVLDDFYVKYVRMYPDRETAIKKDVNDYELLFFIIEECHFYANILFHTFIGYLYGAKSGDEALKRNPLLPANPTFSGQFFAINIAYTYMMFWERSINAYSILFQIDIENDPERNNFNTLYKKLRQREGFRKTKAFQIIAKIKNNGKFNEVDEYRKKYNHDISPLYLKTQKAYKEFCDTVNANQNMDYEHVYRMKNILLQGEDINIINKEMINIVESVINNSKAVHIPSYLTSSDPLKSEDIVKYLDKHEAYTEEDFEGMKKRTNDLLIFVQDLLTIKDHKVQEASKSSDQFPPKLRAKLLYIDSVFRLKEAFKCWVDSYNYEVGMLEEINGDVDNNIYNSQYLLHAACIRLYACYDKLARIIKELGLVKVNKTYPYMTDVINAIDTTRIGNDVILKSVKELDGNRWFQYLSKYRNSIFHRLRPGALSGDDGLALYETWLFAVVFENCLLLEDLFRQLQANL